MHRAVTELERKEVILDAEEHALTLGYQEVERVVEESRLAIEAKRAEITAQKRQHQEMLIEAMKSCGIKGEIVTRGKADAS